MDLVEFKLNLVRSSFQDPKVEANLYIHVSQRKRLERGRNPGVKARPEPYAKCQNLNQTNNQSNNKPYRAIIAK